MKRRKAQNVITVALKMFNRKLGKDATPIKYTKWKQAVIKHLNLAGLGAFLNPNMAIKEDLDIVVSLVAGQWIYELIPQGSKAEQHLSLKLEYLTPIKALQDLNKLFLIRVDISRGESQVDWETFKWDGKETASKMGQRLLTCANTAKNHGDSKDNFTLCLKYHRCVTDIPDVGAFVSNLLGFNHEMPFCKHLIYIRCFIK